jgi:hypothetical protein
MMHGDGRCLDHVSEAIVVLGFAGDRRAMANFAHDYRFSLPLSNRHHRAWPRVKPGHAV